MTQLDTSWYKDINNFAVHTAWLHGFMKAFAVYGVGIFAVLVLAGYWYARTGPAPVKAVAASLWTAVATVVAVAVNQPIGHAVARPRPYASLHGVEVLVSRTTDYSFPSDHAITAGAAAAGLWIIARYAGRPARIVAVAGTVLALLVAFSRVYVGAHYPGDVAAGLAIGAAIAVIGWLILRPVAVAVVTRIGDYRPLRPFVTAGSRSASGAAGSGGGATPAVGRQSPQPR